MRWIARAAILAVAASLSVHAWASPPQSTPASTASRYEIETKAPVTILVSIDGFRADYLDRGVTPNLRALADAGISSAMRPSYPSKTFPNHWTLVTGLRPDRTGIVANKMLDASRPGDTFTMASDDPFWWNAAEPIWVTAEKAGIRTATAFWPGSNVAWGGERSKDWPNPMTGGTRPEDWLQFNQALSDRQRVDSVIDWLRRPAETRPRFVTLYFDEVDTAGHEYGPDDQRTTDAAANVDKAIGRLRDELAKLGQPANLVIVADHGMAAISQDRLIVLDTFSNPDDYDVVEDGVYASINPKAGKQAAVEKALLGAHGPHLACYRKAEVPELSRAGVEYVSTRSIGFNHLDLDYAARVGIEVGNVAYSPDSVADYTLMLILMAVRNAKSVLRRADIHDYRLSDVRGRDLRDLTVGVVGTGRIGAAVLDRLRGFGCQVVAFDNHPKTSADYVRFDELLELSDIVTLHTPLTAETHHLLNRRRISQLKRGAFVVNTGRGALVDTEALAAALESGHLGGAALDVLEGEEGIFYADHSNKPIESTLLVRLQALPNVLISPHTAYYTDRALRDMVENSLANCLNFESRKHHE